MNTYEKICPICKGKGILKDIPYHEKIKRVVNNEIMAKLLKKEGYSIRQIMKYLKYKSTRGIVFLLNKKNREQP